MTEPRLVMGRKIIPADEFAHFSQGRAYLGAAKRHAAGILDEARSRAEQIIRQAEAQAQVLQRQALDKGREEALREFSQSLLDLKAQKARLSQHNSEELVDIALLLTRKLVGDLGCEERLVRMARQSMAALEDAESLRLKVHPNQLHAVRMALQESSHEIDDLSTVIDVVADDEVVHGTAQLQSRLGVINLDLDLQLQELEEILRVK